jgi:hypothetical protein
MSPRVIQLPMSGRDRRHYVTQLRKAEQEYARLVRGADAAHAAADRQLRDAHKLDCDAWSTRQFIGGDLTPSPSIADALHGGRELLEVRCKRCGHEDRVDLALVVWPREKPVHSLGKALECRPCKRDGRPKQRPELVASGPTSTKRAGVISGWKTPFEDPVDLADGRALKTLADARAHILKLKKADQDSPEWQAAIEALIFAAEARGPLMHARVGMLRALTRNVERVFNPDRKDTNWGRPKLKRDR